MNLEKQLAYYKELTQVEAKEKELQETVKKSIAAFYVTEQEEMLSYQEFLWSQFKLIQKRWWMLQFAVLCIVGAMLISAYDESYIQRGMGIMAALFIILIIPELWKNRACQSMEVEESSYYSLRQIYAARMVLFGIVDILLLTVFCGVATIGLYYEFTKLIIQFLVPMLVTACICFETLCSKHIFSESVAIVLCILWSAIWSLVTFNETIYAIISLPMWLTFIVFSFVFLCVAIYRTLNNCNNYWEVAFSGIRIE